METKHTKGEWKVSQSKTERLGNIVVDSNTRNIAKVLSWDLEAKANAKLIAAAPELLEALKCIIEKEKMFNLEIPVVLHEPFRKAEQAIKKATS